ncbi:MAG TPA: ABC transporter ATP-binding protein [Burkholderiales bacterium]|nr:ABC transporter ATP-binding protein [Burkholderiales bacterium]
MPILEIDDLAAGYGDGFVVRGLSLSLERGEFVALLGRNGSGKTTLLRAVQGLLRHVEGRVSLEGGNVARLGRREIARKVAYVPQLSDPVFEFAAGEIVRMGLYARQTRLQGLSAADEEAVDEAMRLTETAALAAKKMAHLSGGERQRVFIARALAQRTPLLLLDEPSLHLDISYQVEIYGLLKRLQRESQKTILAAEHNINLAAAHADRLVFLADGAVVLQGTPRETVREDLIRAIFGAEVDVRDNGRTGLPEISLVTGGPGR